MHSQLNTLHESVVRTLVVPCQDLTGCNATFATAYSCRKNIPDIFTPSGFSSRSVGRRHLRQFTFARKAATGSDRYPIGSNPVMVLPGARASDRGGTPPVIFGRSSFRSKVKNLSSTFANTLHESAVRALVVPCQDLTGCTRMLKESDYPQSPVNTLLPLLSNATINTSTAHSMRLSRSVLYRINYKIWFNYSTILYNI